MNTFSQEQLIFLKTVYSFCQFEYRFSVTEDTTEEQFIQEVIEQAFEDKEYKLALLQKFHTEKQVICILKFICLKIWYKN